MFQEKSRKITAIDLLNWPFPVRPEDVAACCCFYGQPLPKQRSRVFVDGRTGKVRAANPARTAKYEKALRRLLQAETGLRPPDGASAFGVRLWFFRRRRQRADLSNMVKAVEDAGNGVVYADDAQITEEHVKVFQDCEEPRVEIVIHRLRKEQPP